MKYLIAYVAIRFKRSPHELSMSETYFGHLQPTQQAADQVARAIVNKESTAGRTIIPKVLELDDHEYVIDGMYELAEKFDRAFAIMTEADASLRSQPPTRRAARQAARQAARKARSI